MPTGGRTAARASRSASGSRWRTSRGWSRAVTRRLEHALYVPVDVRRRGTPPARVPGWPRSPVASRPPPAGARKWKASAGPCNVAFTSAAAWRRSGWPPEALDGFSREFQEGMRHRPPPAPPRRYRRGRPGAAGSGEAPPTRRSTRCSSSTPESPTARLNSLLAEERSLRGGERRDAARAARFDHAAGGEGALRLPRRHRPAADRRTQGRRR
jgi:hypothetical protein